MARPRERTDERIIGTRYGVYRSATVKGVSEDRRWSAAKLLAVVGTPRELTPNVDAEDGARVPDPGIAEGEVVPRDPEVPAPVARRMYISKKDIERFGRTPGCKGCESLALGKTLQSHTTACRERIEAQLRQTEDGQRRLERATIRINEAVAREGERIMRATSRDDAEQAPRQAEPPLVAAGPLRNRLPALMMAAGHLHLNNINRHQWTREVAMPKLANSNVGGSEVSAESLKRQTNERRSPGVYLTMVRIVGRRGRQRARLLMRIRGRTSPGGPWTRTRWSSRLQRRAGKADRTLSEV